MTDTKNPTSNFNDKNSEETLALAKYRDLQERMKEIAKRHSRIKEELEDHTRKRWFKWVNEEKAKALKQHSDTDKLEYTPPNSKNNNRAERESNAFNQARSRVNTRIGQRMDNLEIIKTRMQNTVTHQALIRYRIEQASQMNGSQLTARNIMENEVKSVTQRANRLRADLMRHYDSHKSKWVESARQSGHSQPELEAYARFRSRNTAITDATENLVKQSYQRHGFTYEPVNYSLTRTFNEQRM